jgi:hypothetical protein
MNTCLYCPKEADSVEHPLPAAFGEFEEAPLLDARICEACNNKRLGVLDEQLCRSGPEAILRRFFGIQGRSNREKVNPYHRGSAGGQRLRMKAYDQSLGIEVELESRGGYEARQLCQMVFVEASGEMRHLVIPDDLDTPEKLRDAYRKLGVKDIAKATIQLICDPEERVRLEPLILAVWPRVSFSAPVLGATQFEKAVIDLQLTDRYFRAIAKIGFHYFLTQFPDLSGSEPCFSEIRHFILEERGSIMLANKFVGKRSGPLLGELRGGSRPDGWVAHVLAGEIRPGACLAHVQLFVCQDYPAPAYTIRLGTFESSSSIRARRHAYIYFEEGKKGKFSGKAHPLSDSQMDSEASPLQPVVAATVRKHRS